MTETSSYVLSRSLLLARLGQVAVTLPTEQQLLERLHVAGQRAGCRTADMVTALYIGLKLHLRVCMCGPSRDRVMALFDTVVATLVGVGTEQSLHLHGSIGSDEMSKRFAAIRLGDFISTSIEPVEQGKAWFLLVDTPGDPSATLQWVEREIAATLRAHGRPGHVLPANVFVLVAGGETPVHRERCWLVLPTPQWHSAVHKSSVAAVPPVGYQRHLLEHQLTGAAYRRRLRNGGSWRYEAEFAKLYGLAPEMVTRWLAASVDDRQRGLWVADDPMANARKAITVLEALHPDRRLCT